MRAVKYRTYIIMFVLVLTSLASQPAWAQSLTLQDLVRGVNKYDGKRVLVEGEAIGHVMPRGDYAWFNLNDKTASMGVWISVELAKQIQFLGRHAVQGDWVRIDGLFSGRCQMHGGDADIHADSMVVVKRGAPKYLTYDQRKANLLLFLIGLMVCLYIIKTLKKKR